MTTHSDEWNFRRKTLEDFISQDDLKKTLRLILDSAHQQSVQSHRQGRFNDVHDPGRLGWGAGYGRISGCVSLSAQFHPFV